jgi:glucokinase
MPAIGIDIGKTNIKLVVIDQAGNVTAQESAPTPGDAEVVDVVRTMALRYRKQHGESTTSLGLSAPGLASPDLRTITSLPGGQPAIEGIDWTEALDWSEDVPILNDANAALFAEAQAGAAKGFSHAFMLTLGTGVGGAVLIDGKLYHGRTGKAGHLGHISIHPDWTDSILGMPGTLEYAFGDWSIGERSGGRFDSTKALVRAHLNGDGQATQIWLAAIGHLARGIASLTNILDPQIIVLGGGITKAGNALFTPLRERVAALEWNPTGQRVSIVPAELGPDAGAIGAALYAAQSLESVGTR